MPAKVARRLVIDASVGAAAGEKSDPTSRNCREFLEAARRFRYIIVLPEQLMKEWNNHRSLFARRWLTSMVTKSQVISPDVPAMRRLRREIEQAVAPRAAELRAMRKDYHLLEAALATEQNVISLDEIVRALFAAAAGQVVALKNLVWVNPDKPEEEAIVWLEKNAKRERKRMLGFRAKSG